MIKGMKEYSNSLASHSNNNVRFMVEKKRKKGYKSKQQNQRLSRQNYITQNATRRPLEANQLDSESDFARLILREKALYNFFHICGSTSRPANMICTFPFKNVKCKCLCVFTENSVTHCQRNDVRTQKHPTVFGSVSSIHPGWFTEKT